ARTRGLRTNRLRPNELSVSPLPCIAVMLALGGLLVTPAKSDQNRQFDFTGALDLSRHQWIVLVILAVRGLGIAALGHGPAYQGGRAPFPKSPAIGMNKFRSSPINHALWTANKGSITSPRWALVAAVRFSQDAPSKCCPSPPRGRSANDERKHPDREL